MKHSSFAATISALDVETSAFGLDAETSALGAATSAIARSYQGYRRGVSGDIGDCGVGITPQMCNRVTNHGDMSTFSKPESQCLPVGMVCSFFFLSYCFIFFCLPWVGYVGLGSLGLIVSSLSPGLAQRTPK